MYPLQRPRTTTRETGRVTTKSVGAECAICPYPDTIRKTQAELERLTVKVVKVGIGDLAGVRARRYELWKLIRASAFDKTLTNTDARRANSAASLGSWRGFGF
jgi:hypothetical protein